MKPISAQRFQSLMRSCKGAAIAVVGDIMLDRYLWGTVNRISPEAPVPVVEIEAESNRLGGAANVANNIAALGATPILTGVIGADSAGKQIRILLDEKKFETVGLVVDRARPSTVKTRIIAHSQQVVRTDRESREEITGAILKKIFAVVENLQPDLKGIILQDYNKGLLTPQLIHSLCEFGKKHNILVTVDPKFSNFFEYLDVHVFKPNQREVENVLGKSLYCEDEFIRIGHGLQERLRCKNLLITRGNKGMTLFESSGEVSHIPTHAKEVHDVSGAGDTVISTLTTFLTAGAHIMEAAVLANYAASVVCSEIGVVPISPEKLESELLMQAGT